MQDALQNDLKQDVTMLWHKDKDLSMFSKSFLKLDFDSLEELAALNRGNPSTTSEFAEQLHLVVCEDFGLNNRK